MTRLSLLLALGVSCTVMAADLTPFQVAATNAALAKKFSASIVTVQYYVKKNAEGREPKFEVPYKCPNCDSTHWRASEVSSDKGIPAEFAGFLIAPDRVLMKDLRVDPDFVDHIVVVCGNQSRPAVEYEVSSAREAMVLKLDAPFEGAIPLTFVQEPAPRDPRYFYLVREGAITFSGFAPSKAGESQCDVETGISLYMGQPNTVVLNDKNEPVTIALEDLIVLGNETFSPPTSWSFDSIATRRSQRQAWRDRIGRAVLPIYLQLEAKPKSDDIRSRFRFSSDDDAKNDIDTIGVVLSGGRVIVLTTLAAADTARLTKIEATLPDGTKATLSFVGSYREEGAFAAAFEGGLPASVEPFVLDDRPARALHKNVFDACYVGNYGGRILLTDGTVRVTDFHRTTGNVPVAQFEWRSGIRRDYSNHAPLFVLAADGKLVAMDVPNRQKRSHDTDEVQGAQLARLAETTAFDAENIPRASEDRRRTPWLGVDVQVAGVDVLREKKALAYFMADDDSFTSRYAMERAALVTEVVSNTPASELGILPGDILLSVKSPGVKNTKTFTLEDDMTSGINWEEAFDHSNFIEISSLGVVTPWPNLDGGINETLAKFGVGAEVEIAWVSEGVRKCGTTKLVLAPVHYSNAPRVRNKDLAITVCDMTAEVRKYFKLDNAAPGVVIAKVKGGGVGAVAGLKPLELILDVNGEGVMSAKDFQEKTRDKKELSFTIRRLGTTRIVPIKL